MANIRVTGAKELQAAFKNLDTATTGRIVRKVMREGAKVIQRESVALAPRKSGLVARSIKVRAGFRKKGTFRYQVIIGAQNFQGDSFYGAFLNFGHKIGKRGSSKPRKQVAGSEWLNRAFHNKAPQLARQLPVMLWDGIAKEAAGLYRRVAK